MARRKMTTDLRTLVTLEAWQNPRFKAKVKRNPKKAVEELAVKYGFQVPANVRLRVASDTNSIYHLVIADNPVGASPSELRRAMGRRGRRLGPGTVNTYTADCGCSDTYTGGCPCGTIFGTPCAACATILLC